MYIHTTTHMENSEVLFDLRHFKHQMAVIHCVVCMKVVGMWSINLGVSSEYRVALWQNKYSTSLVISRQRTWSSYPFRLFLFNFKMKSTSTLVTIVAAAAAVVYSADAKKDKDVETVETVEVVEVVEVVKTEDVDAKLVTSPTYWPTYSPTVTEEDEVSSM